MQTELVKNIFLPPHFLTKDLKLNILIQLKKQFEEAANKEDGFITNIDPHFSIENNFISTSSSDTAIFRIRFKADVLKPEVGSVYQGRVIVVNELGIILSVSSEKMNILIPSRRLDGLTFNRVEHCFEGVFKGQPRIVKEQDILETEIISVRFDKKFTCIGVMK